MTSKKILGMDEFAPLARRHAAWIANGHRESADKEAAPIKLWEEDIRGLRMRDAALDGLDVSHCRLTDCEFIRCDLAGISWFSTIMTDCRFVECCFSRGDLRGSRMPNCVFRKCNFARADLMDTDFRGADLSDSILDWAWLMDADLRGAKMDRVKLDSTRIGELKLHGVRLRDPIIPKPLDIKDADFSPNGDGSLILSGDAAMKKLLSP